MKTLAWKIGLTLLLLPLILISNIYELFRPTCPLVLDGYKCRANCPGGCQGCGRTDYD